MAIALRPCGLIHAVAPCVASVCLCSGVIPVPVPALLKKKQKLNTSLPLVEKTSESVVNIILRHPVEEEVVRLVVQSQEGVVPAALQGMEGWEEGGGTAAGLMG